jgi:putative membrane protein
VSEVTVALVLAQMMDRGDHMDNGNGWWWVMGIGALVVLSLFVVLIVVLVRRDQSSEPSSRRAVDGTSSAESVLADRLARGEIDEDEYRRRRDALRECEGER